MTIAAVIFTFIFVAGLVWAESSSSPTLRPLKMIASTGFILVALSSGALSNPYGRIVLAALVLSWVGDILLTYQSRQAFLGGLVAFLLGHVAYSAAFGYRGVEPVAAGIAVVAVALLAIFVWRWLAPHVGDMAAPVMAYIVIISVMVVLAFGTSGSDPNWMITTGAVLFFASDIFVARNQFVAPGIVNRVWGLPLYYLAQVLLALTAAG
ncbi:MAG: lysoplasmalogenase [Actinomycetota bacterium]